MRIKTVAKLLGILVVAVIVAGVAILYTTDLTAVRATVERQVERALERQVTIAGDMSFSLSLSPSVALGEVTLANPPGASRPEMATIGRLEGQVELLPLLRGDIRIVRLVANDLDLVLETDADGRPNWLFGRDDAPAPTAAPAEERAFPHLGEVAVTGGRITYLVGDGTSWVVDIAEGSLSTGTLTGPTALRFDGRLQDVPVAIEGSVGPLAAFVGAPADWPVDLTLRVADSRLRANGTLMVPDVVRGYSLTLDGEIASLAPFAQLAGADLPDLPALTLRTALRDREGLITLDQLELRAGRSDLAGEIAVDTGGARPTVTGRLTSDRLDLADFAGADDAAPAAPGDGRLIPDTPLALDGLDAVDVGIDLAIGRLEFDDDALEAVAGRLGVTDGTLTLTIDQARLWRGALAGTFVARGGSAVPRLDVDMTLSRFDLGGLLAQSGATDQLEGLADLTLSLAGEGATLRRVAATASGRAGLTMEQGRVQNSTLELLGQNMLTGLLPQAQSRDSTRLNCAVARFAVTGGVARSTALLVDTPLVTIAGEGAIDLGQEQLDILLNPRTKDAAGLALTAPVRLHGSLANPSVSIETAEMLARGAASLLLGAINPAAMLVPFVTADTGGGNPCVAALSGQTAAPTSGPAATVEDVQRTLQDVGEGAGGVLDQIGRDAEGLLDGLGRGARGLFGN